ncbi:MAG: acetyl-CoA carboxylase biotin carboxyl carrier protein subunit [candidate division Zixibacteria bacterium]|nr:acetyl-CoA carboxylase biotin carboxyl carrier protein subunit [candidate division Zixibacteria bacterium]
MRRYMVSVDGKDFDIEIKYRSEKYYLTCNGRKIETVTNLLGESRALLLIDGESHEVDVRSNGYDTSRTVFMKGMEIPVSIEDYNLAQLRKAAGMSSGVTVAKILKAAMPGLVLEVKVQSGDEVTKGQPLIVLEAMKMENIIKAQGKGTVKAVHVESGGAVEKGDSLLEFE